LARWWQLLRLLIFVVTHGLGSASSFVNVLYSIYLNLSKNIHIRDGYPIFSLSAPALFSPLAAHFIARTLYRGIHNRNLPNLMSLAVTDGCNARCGHGSFYEGVEDPGRPLLRLEEIRRLIPEAQELGVSILNLVGGEPLLRPDLAAIIASVDKSLSTVLLFTNGWHLAAQGLLTPSPAAASAERGNAYPSYPGVVFSAWISSHRSVGGACGTSYPHLSPYGDVMSCDFNHAIFGNLREEPLWRVWNGSAPIRSSPQPRPSVQTGRRGGEHGRTGGRDGPGGADRPAVHRADGEQRPPRPLGLPLPRCQPGAHARLEALRARRRTADPDAAHPLVAGPGAHRTGGASQAAPCRTAIHAAGPIGRSRDRRPDRVTAAAGRADDPGSGEAAQGRRGGTDTIPKLQQRCAC
jgi:hypothetical protein